MRTSQPLERPTGLSQPAGHHDSNIDHVDEAPPSLTDLVPPHADGDWGSTPFRALETWTRWEKLDNEMTNPWENLTPSFIFPKNPLTYDQEIELLNKVREGGPEGDEARARIIEANLRLVLAVVLKKGQKLATPAMEIDDLFQEGVLGLHRAVDNYDPNKANGTRFGVYARHHIWTAVRKAVNSSSDSIYYPEHYRRTAWTVARIGERLTHTLGRDPTYAEVATHASNTWKTVNIDASTVNHLFAEGLLQRHPPAHNPAHESDPSLLAPIYLPPAETPGTTGDRVYIGNIIHECCEDLSDRIKEIIALRFPKDPDQTPMTLEEIGDRYGISKQRISQIERDTFELLRKRLEKRGVHPSVL